MAVYLSKELMRWAADMEEKVKNMGSDFVSGIIFYDCVFCCS